MPRRVLAVLLLAALLSPGLAACTGTPLGTIISQGTGGKVRLGEASVPEGFPAEVPLYDGKATYGIAVGEGDGTAYNVTIRIPDQSAGEQIRTDLEAAGFSLLGGADSTAQGGAIYNGENWNVAVVLTQDDQGWLANYTVTPKDSSGSQG